jgi:general secretion pathway protein D
MAPRFDIGAVTGSAAAGGGGGGAFGELFGAGAAATEAEQIGWQELVDIIKRNVNNMADPSVAAWTDEGGPAAIDYMNGLLVVTQTRQGHQRVGDLLEKLRRERAIMISVESRFVTVADDFLQDITLDVDVQFDPGATGRWNPAGQIVEDPSTLARGTQFGTLPGQVGGVAGTPRWGSPIIVSSTGSNGLGTSTLLPVAGTSFANFNANEGGMAVSGVFLDDLQIGFLLRAIQADSRSTTLFSPRITLYNGQRSYISISNVITYLADAEPVVAEAAVAWDPVIGSIPVGATLDVKATVSADRRYVQLDLRPQVADTAVANWRQVPVQAVAPGGIATFLIDLPQVQVSDLKTTVSVPDGGTLLLGGNKRYGETEAETGVPILNKVPFLRRVFNNRASLRTNSNLLILIRPKILIQSEEEHKLGYDDF